MLISYQNNFMDLSSDLHHSIVREFALSQEKNKVKHLLDLKLVNKSLSKIATKVQADCFNCKELNLRKIFSSKIHLSKGKIDPDTIKKQFLACVKSLKHRLKAVDISFLNNCSDNDIATIFELQVGLKSFVFNRSGISNEILPLLVNLDHLKIKHGEVKSGEVFKLSDEVIDVIATQNPQLKTLHLDDRNLNITNKSIATLKKLPIANLALYGSKLEDKEIEELLIAYPKLKKLKLINVPIRNRTLKAISRLAELTKLHIDKHDLFKFSHLSKLKMLEVLNIKEMNDNVEINFDFLLTMPNLKEIFWETSSNFIPNPILIKLKENRVQVDNFAILPQ